MAMIDYDLLEVTKGELTTAFQEAKPFRWLMVDGFLRAPWPERLYREFGEVVETSGKDPNAPKKHRHVLRKLGIAKPEQMHQVHRDFFQAIQEPRFVGWLEEVTRISPIYADPSLNGGGLHEIYEGGYLNVHTDFNFHPETGRHRRLNILYYLNPTWQDEWEGRLELWPTDLSTPFVEIVPLMNRMVVFETSEISFHGHPKALRVPAGITRRSLATYYYSDWPEGLERRAKTNYRLVPWQVQTLRAAIAELRERGLSDEAVIDDLSASYQPADVVKVMRA
jgi:hypothetical protein